LCGKNGGCHGKKAGQNIEGQASEIFNLHKKIETLENSCKKLETSNVLLNEKKQSAKIETLENNIDELDQYFRNVNLLVHGVPTFNTTGGSEANLSHHITQILNQNLGTSFQESDIVSTHRIGRPTNNARPNGAKL
jgi:hypothetical protein